MKSLTLRIFFIFIFAHSHNCTFAQDSSHVRIALLTCTPGEELYSTFGHSAFRVVDTTAGTDLVYNYGTFDFNTPDFYLKFIRGKLLYCVTEDQFADFKEEYQLSNRSIREQVLNLSQQQKIDIIAFLKNNIKEENKYYKYDFFFDNCTTRLRDILKQKKDSDFCNAAVMPKGTRFRQAIHQYLDDNGQQWSKLGIDILLGQPCDAVMTPEQMQFLPDNLMNSLDSTRATMVVSAHTLYEINKANKKSSLTPFLIFSIFAVLLLLGSYVANKYLAAAIKTIYSLLFFATGLLGILLIFMWTATDHSMCKNNFNLLWALPSNFFMAFFLFSKKTWVKKYFAVTAVLLALVLLCWFFLPQQLNVGLIPVVLLLLYKSARQGFGKVKA
jgi:hypothetical protein